MIHLITYGRAHLIGGEKYKNDKPPHRFVSSRSNAALLLEPMANNVTQRGRRWLMRLNMAKMQTTLPVCAHAESCI